MARESDRDLTLEVRNALPFESGDIVVRRSLECRELGPIERSLLNGASTNTFSLLDPI